MQGLLATARLSLLSQLCSFNPLLNDGMQWLHRGNLVEVYLVPYQRLT